MKKKFLSLGLSILMASTMIFTGVQNVMANESSSSNGSNSSNTLSEKWANFDKSKFEGVTLKAFTSYGKIEKAMEEFTQVTGIKVETTPLSTGAALAKLNAEEGKTDVDVWLGGGADAYIAAKEKGYLEKYESEESKDIDANYKDPDGFWTGVSFQAAGIIVNTEVLKSLGLEEPKTWNDLLDPKYKDEIIFANPAISGTAYSMLETMYQDWGEEKTFDYLKKLNENISYYTEGGGEPTKKVAAGEFAVGFSPITGEYYALSEEHPVKVIIPEDLLPWIPSPVAIFKNSKNMEAAKVFVDYFTSKEGGESLQKAEARIMTRDDVSMPEIMKGASKASLVNMDPAKMKENREKLIAKFKEIAGGKAPIKKKN